MCLAWEEYKKWGLILLGYLSVFRRTGCLGKGSFEGGGKSVQIRCIFFPSEREGEGQEERGKEKDREDSGRSSS